MTILNLKNQDFLILCKWGHIWSGVNGTSFAYYTLLVFFHWIVIVGLQFLACRWVLSWSNYWPSKTFLPFFLKKLFMIVFICPELPSTVQNYQPSQYGCSCRCNSLIKILKYHKWLLIQSTFGWNKCKSFPGTEFPAIKQNVEKLHEKCLELPSFPLFGNTSLCQKERNTLTYLAAHNTFMGQTQMQHIKSSNNK